MVRAPTRCPRPMHEERLTLSRNDWMPNNPRLPVRIYRGLRMATDAPFDAAAFDARFSANGWPPDWRGGVYDYHHFHSSAHEVLGVAAGTATLMLGGPDGTIVEVGAGDALLLPVGTGHCCVRADAAFCVVGAYPRGQDWDIQRSAPDVKTLERMHAVPDPRRDPVTGKRF
jgi:uncharacterized protein YjlB